MTANMDAAAANDVLYAWVATYPQFMVNGMVGSGVDALVATVDAYRSRNRISAEAAANVAGSGWRMDKKARAALAILVDAAR